ncbi:MAG: hypothetical protein V1652_00670 [bacterium]
MKSVLKEIHKKTPSLRSTVIFVLGALCATTLIFFTFFFSPSTNLKEIPTIFSSAYECEITTGEACFLYDCTTNICPPNFKKGWMPQSMKQTVSSTAAEIPLERKEITQSVPDLIADKIVCSSKNPCPSNSKCGIDEQTKLEMCYRTCVTNEDCSISHEEGTCTENGWCSLPMIELQ